MQLVKPKQLSFLKGRIFKFKFKAQKELDVLLKDKRPGGDDENIGVFTASDKNRAVISLADTNKKPIQHDGHVVYGRVTKAPNWNLSFHYHDGKKEHDISAPPFSSEGINVTEELLPVLPKVTKSGVAPTRAVAMVLEGAGKEYAITTTNTSLWIKFPTQLKEGDRFSISVNGGGASHYQLSIDYGAHNGWSSQIRAGKVIKFIYKGGEILQVREHRSPKGLFRKVVPAFPTKSNKEVKVGFDPLVPDTHYVVRQRSRLDLPASPKNGDAISLEFVPGVTEQMNIEANHDIVLNGVTGPRVSNEEFLGGINLVFDGTKWIGTEHKIYTGMIDIVEDIPTDHLEANVITRFSIRERNVKLPISAVEGDMIYFYDGVFQNNFGDITVEKTTHDIILDGIKETKLTILSGSAVAYQGVFKEGKWHFVTLYNDVTDPLSRLGLINKGPLANGTAEYISDGNLIAKGNMTYIADRVNAKIIYDAANQVIPPSPIPSWTFNVGITKEGTKGFTFEFNVAPETKWNFDDGNDFFDYTGPKTIVVPKGKMLVLNYLKNYNEWELLLDDVLVESSVSVELEVRAAETIDIRNSRAFDVKEILNISDETVAPTLNTPHQNIKVLNLTGQTNKAAISGLANLESMDQIVSMEINGVDYKDRFYVVNATTIGSKSRGSGLLFDLEAEDNITIVYDQKI